MVINQFNEKILGILEQVCDPEIPVLTIQDMGIIRDIRLDQQTESIDIDITPTYTGCPAMDAIHDDIIAALKNEGFTNVQVHQVISPPWTTDWITERGRTRLLGYGIAPPEKSSDKRKMILGKPLVKCPQCKSSETVLISEFGSTACKALYKCLDCKEPFDYFKCI